MSIEVLKVHEWLQVQHNIENTKKLMEDWSKLINNHLYKVQDKRSNVIGQTLIDGTTYEITLDTPRVLLFDDKMIWKKND